MADRDVMCKCPYDPSHMIRSSRFEIHLIKCKKNFSTNIETCPFNAKHQFKRNEFRHHIASCPDRNRLGKEQMINEEIDVGHYESSTSLNQASFTNDTLTTFGECDEDWDQEIKQVPVIQPKKMPAKISYSILQPAERKNHHKELVAQFAQKNE